MNYLKLKQKSIFKKKLIKMGKNNLKDEYARFEIIK